MDLFAISGLIAATAAICGTMARVEGRSWLGWTITGGVATAVAMVFLGRYLFAAPAVALVGTYLAFWVLRARDDSRSTRRFRGGER